MVGLPSKPRPASHEPYCYEQYDECVKLCEGATTTECVELCQEQRRDCLDIQDVPYDDSSAWDCDLSDWSCELSDSDDYDYSEESTDAGGFDCSADNYDEGESDSDGDDGVEWGEDWGERLPAGGDGVDTPTDMPTDD
jgi:hypothetical protein